MKVLKREGKGEKKQNKKKNSFRKQSFKNYFFSWILRMKNRDAEMLSKQSQELERGGNLNNTEKNVSKESRKKITVVLKTIQA